MNLNQYWNSGTLKNGQGLKELCCGCGVCKQACPKEAISLEQNEEGFYYPVINEKSCVSCGICVEKCQCISDKEYITTLKNPEVYAVINNDENTLKRSSSGGAAYVLAKYILLQNGVVFGAVYDENMKVKHQKTENIDELWRVQGSKYVQSDIGETYKQARECLEIGKKVLFMGTPCQVGGLYFFLGRDYEELYTMDIICYGVPSPGIFSDYIKWKESKIRRRINSINFRSKILRWGDSVMEINCDKKKKLVYHSENDEWYQTFLSHTATRESCHYCMYTNMQRKADITVGDFWGIEKFRPELDCRKGISKVLINTDKGKMIFEKISSEITLEGMELESAIRPNLEHPPKRAEKREEFLSDYKKSGFYTAFVNNVKKTVPIKARIKRWLKIKLKSKAAD